MAAAKDKNANLKPALPELDLRAIAELQALHSQLLASNFPVRLPSIHPLGLSKLRDALTARKRRLEEKSAPVAKEFKVAPPSAEEGDIPVGKEGKTSVAKDSQDPVTKDNELPVAMVNDTLFAKDNQIPVAKDNDTRVAKDNQIPVAKDNDTLVAKDNQIPVAKDNDTRVAKGSEIPVTKETKVAVAKVNASPFAKENKVAVAKDDSKFPIAKVSEPAGEDNAEQMSDIEPRNRSVSDPAVFQLQKAFVASAKDLAQLREQSFGLNAGPDGFGLNAGPDGFGLNAGPEGFGLNVAPEEAAERAASLEAAPNGPAEALSFFECPKMILCANKPSVITWTSTPMKKDGGSAPEDSLAKMSEASGSQSSSPAQQSNSDGEKESDSSRMTFGEVSLPCPLSGCDNIASEEKEGAQNHLMETDAAENSSESGKPGGRPPKLARCKLCHLEFMGKENLWKHLGEAHFKENALRCEFCPFVTRYRHHFEYHLRNHFGEKPYRCDKCEYKCVNKSMLASHQKSHTNIYQYKCDTCGYASKYYHSMKQHIDKTQHKLSSQQPSCSPRPHNGPMPAAPATSPPSLPHNFSFPSNVVLPIGMQGVPILNGVNLIAQPHPPRPPLLAPRVPDPAISAPAQLLPGASLAPPMFLNAASNHSDFPVISRHGPGLAGPLGAPLAFQQFQNALSLFALDQNQMAACPEPGQPHPATAEMSDPMPARMVPPPLLTCPQLIKKELQKSVQIEEEELEDEEEEEAARRKEKEAEERSEAALDGEKSPEDAAAILAKLHYCKHCEIYFKNAVTFQCHAGCHNFDEPFKCNRCGYRASDPISFMNHHMCSQL